MFDTTVDAVYNEVGYNELLSILNSICEFGWPAVDIMLKKSVYNGAGYNESLYNERILL